jgi:hypothetical protein
MNFALARLDCWTDNKSDGRFESGRTAPAGADAFDKKIDGMQNKSSQSRIQSDAPHVQMAGYSVKIYGQYLAR